MTNDRGQYGSKESTPWWKIALGATIHFSGAYLVLRRHGKEAEKDAAWDTYYAKRKLRLSHGEHVPMEWL
jgi:hypothetical protein